MANWGKSRESLGKCSRLVRHCWLISVWYGFYHGTLFILCLMLVTEEVINVRFGTFAPQVSLEQLYLQQMI